MKELLNTTIQTIERVYDHIEEMDNDYAKMKHKGYHSQFFEHESYLHACRYTKTIKNK